ncbi:MAG: hypothetical protein ABL867_07290 [Rickettsiales bacterium]
MLTVFAVLQVTSVFAAEKPLHFVQHNFVANKAIYKPDIVEKDFVNGWGISNLGDGTIAAYNSNTSEFIDYIRDAKGKPIKNDKIWGILFGNGESLGDKDALYFAAGPDDENDGVFGSSRVVRK